MSSWKELQYDALGGVWSAINPADIPQGPGNEGWKGVLHFAQAKNAFHPQNLHDIATRPGMADVRATTINANAIFTGIFHQGDLADRLILWASIAAGTHKPYQDDGNPPSLMAPATAFTVGQDNLVSMVNFQTDGTTRGTVCASRQRDTMQFINTSGVVSDFTPTGTIKAKYLEVFGRRLLMANVVVNGTTYATRVYHSDLRDGDLLTDVGTQFNSFETEQGGDVTAVKKLGNVCMVATPNNVFMLIPTDASLNPYAFQELMAGRFKGPISHQGVVEAEGKLWWASRTNFHSVDLEGKVEDIGDPVLDTILDDLNDARRELIVGGYDPQNGLILWSVTNSGSTAHDRVMAYDPALKTWYPDWTLSVNAMGNRVVSGNPRLILGGYAGLFRNFPSGTTGSTDDATAVIDADIITPRHHCLTPHLMKLFAGVKVTFDPQGTSESVTVQYRLNDASSWNSFTSSPYSVRSTAGDVDVKFFNLMKAGTHLQLRFRDANSGQVMQIQKYSILYRPLTNAPVFLKT